MCPPLRTLISHCLLAVNIQDYKDCLDVMVFQVHQEDRATQGHLEVLDYLDCLELRVLKVQLDYQVALE